MAEKPTHKFAILLLLVFAQASYTKAQSDDVPTTAARRVAAEIRREALLPPNGVDGRPLPLASHWNVGTVRRSFEPDHQIGLIQAGHHILPWMSWPQGDPDSERFELYYGPDGDRELTEGQIPAFRKRWASLSEYVREIKQSFSREYLLAFVTLLCSIRSNGNRLNSRGYSVASIPTSNPSSSSFS